MFFFGAEKMPEVAEEFRSEQFVTFDSVMSISAKNKDNVDDLMQKLREVIDHHSMLDKEAELKSQEEKALEETRAELTEHYGKGHI